MGKELTKEQWRDQCKGMIKASPLIPGRGKILVSREPSTSTLATFTDGKGKSVELVRPDAHKEPAMRGIVIAHGLPKLNGMGGPIAPWTKLGQTVTFAQYTGKQYNLGPHEFVVMDEDEVIAAIAE